MSLRRVGVSNEGGLSDTFSFLRFCIVGDCVGCRFAMQCIDGSCVHHRVYHQDDGKWYSNSMGG